MEVGGPSLIAYFKSARHLGSATLYPVILISGGIMNWGVFSRVEPIIVFYDSAI